MRKSAEELAKEYVDSLPLGQYGKEFDAFLAGFIACLENWKWYDKGESGRDNTEAVPSLDVPRR